MSLAVVRCPSCRGASRVALEAVGHMVGCPRCQTPFVAEEDIPIVQPIVRGTKLPQTAAPAIPVAPPRQRPRPSPFESQPEPAAPPLLVLPTPQAVLAVPDPEHDPHTRPVAGLPVSVLVGLSLLPFGIPLLWRVAPLLTGQESVLSLAVPTALAVAAAALCLGVVYTIDWTATTRVKGVLMLVFLAYLSAAGLFFLKKDLMDRVRAFGGDPNAWSLVALREGKCQTRMPGQAMPTTADQHPLTGLVSISDSRRARYTSDVQGDYEYLFAVSAPNAADWRPDDAWFVSVREKLRGANGEVMDEMKLVYRESAAAPGRQWMFRLSDTVLIVRVYAVGGRVYYLSAEGPRLQPNDSDLVTPFFDSFFVQPK